MDYHRITDLFMYISSFKPYVFLPVLIFIFSLYFRLKVSQAIYSSLIIGIGFLGIFIVFGYFIDSIAPAVTHLIIRTGVSQNVLDVGWTPLSAIAWANTMSPLYVVLIFGTNLFMIFANYTETLNIDIWNYWHFIMAGTLVYETTQNAAMAIAATILTAVITLKCADWSAPAVERFTQLPGVSITTFSGQAYLPVGVFGNLILDRIPVLKDIHLNPESLKHRIGLLGEPIIIGFMMGVLLGISAGYDVKNTAQLGIEFAGVTYLIPLMSGIIAQGLMPISEGLQGYSEKRFSKTGRRNYIGLHYAVLMKNDSVIVSGIILMPIALFLALILPGSQFIPLGEIANISSVIFIIAVVTGGNVFRTVLLGIPVIIGKIYVASGLAAVLTELYRNPQLSFKDHNGLITSFLEGGNLIRFWLLKISHGNTISLLLIPIIIILFILCSQWAKKQRHLINSPTRSLQK